MPIILLPILTISGQTMQSIPLKAYIAFTWGAIILAVLNKRIDSSRSRESPTELHVIVNRKQANAHLLRRVGRKQDTHRDQKTCVNGGTFKRLLKNVNYQETCWNLHKAPHCVLAGTHHQQLTLRNSNLSSGPSVNAGNQNEFRP